MNEWFGTSDELAYLRQKLQTTYRNASVRPENAADARNLLRGIRDDLKAYYERLKGYEMANLRRKAQINE